MEKLYWINAPHFCAGVVAKAGIITDTAPCLAGWLGKREGALVFYCRRKKWQIELVSGTLLPL